MVALVRAKSRRRPRRANHRLVKIHRSYTVDEAAKLCGVAKGTVRRWIKTGDLAALTERKPALILGPDLAEYLKAAGSKLRRKLALHQCYCFRCRDARSPAFRFAEYVPLTGSTGNLRAFCEECSTVMNKAVPMAVLRQLRSLLKLTIGQAEQHLMDVALACLNDHLPKDD